MQSFRGRAAVVIAVALTATACSGGVDPKLESGSARGWSDSPTASAPSPTAESTPPPLIDPTTTIGQVSQTVVGWINGDVDALNPDQVNSLAAPVLAQALGAAGLITPVVQLSTSAPFTVNSYRSQGNSSELQLTTSRGVPATLDLAVDASGKLEGIRGLATAPEESTWADVDQAISSLGTTADSVIAARITNGSCVPVHATNAGAELQIASVSKLYVLGALLRAVDNGTVSFDETLTITDDVKSAPSGELQNLPAGTEVTVRDAAEKMISISDNTATDLLIDRLGRAAVEDELTLMGHHDPADLTPFPTTKEVFLTGWGVPNQRTAWQAADTEQRRAILTSLDDRPLDLDFASLVNSPGSAQDVGWFATAGDICNAYAGLLNGPLPDEARRILGIQPLIQLDRAQWPYVGAKSGNLPGDVIGSWLATDAAGQDWVFATQIESDRPIGQLENGYVFSVAQSAFGIIASN
ncbi:serine hydrolase [Actinomycetes bacterium M1A6_2h]